MIELLQDLGRRTRADCGSTWPRPRVLLHRPRPWNIPDQRRDRRDLRIRAPLDAPRGAGASLRLGQCRSVVCARDEGESPSGLRASGSLARLDHAGRHDRRPPLEQPLHDPVDGQRGASAAAPAYACQRRRLVRRADAARRRPDGVGRLSDGRARVYGTDSRVGYHAAGCRRARAPRPGGRRQRTLHSHAAERHRRRRAGSCFLPPPSAHKPEA